MTKAEIGNLSFQSINKSRGVIPEAFPPEDQETSLQRWYRTVYALPFKEWDISDLARACQQQLKLNYVVPYSLDTLLQDPIAGDWYDGQLVLGVASIPRAYWRENPDQAATMRSIMAAVLDQVSANLELDDMLRDEARALSRLADELQRVASP